MPLAIPAVQGLLLANMSGNALLGTSVTNLSAAIATGFVSYAQGSLQAVSVDVGTLGAGTGIAPTIALPAPALVASLLGTLTAAGVNGPAKAQLANAVGLGISQALLSAQVSTVNPGVGVGTGKVTLIPNSAAHSAQMIAAFSGLTLVGVSAQAMATAIAQGIDAVLPTAVAVAVIVGPPNVVPGGGVGTGRVL